MDDGSMSCERGHADAAWLHCQDCGATFGFSVGEQAFYASRGFAPPKRCPSCRDERRRQREAAALRQARRIAGSPEP